MITKIWDRLTQITLQRTRPLRLQNKTENDARLLKNREGNRHSLRSVCRGKETLFLQVTKIGKIRKNVRSKLVDDCPKLSNEPNETQKKAKRIEIHQSQTMTF